MGHEGAITDFKWNMSNEMIVSCSVDKTFRVWEVKTGECLKILKCGSETTCCALHPSKNTVALVRKEKLYLSFRSFISKITENLSHKNLIGWTRK